MKNARRAHDGDGDESLDGLELLKAVLHAHGEHDGGANARGGYADERSGGDTSAPASVSEETFAEVEGDCCILASLNLSCCSNFRSCLPPITELILIN